MDTGGTMGDARGMADGDWTKHDLRTAAGLHTIAVTDPTGTVVHRVEGADSEYVERTSREWYDKHIDTLDVHAMTTTGKPTAEAVKTLHPGRFGIVDHVDWVQLRGLMKELHELQKTGLVRLYTHPREP